MFFKETALAPKEFMFWEAVEINKKCS